MEKICKRVCGCLVAAMLMCGGMVPAASALSIEYKLSDPAIMVGSTFNLDIIVDEAEGFDSVLSFGFDVSADAADFDYNGALIPFPPFFDDSAFFPETEVAGSTFAAVSGDDILLASLSFTALKAGDFIIEIISDLRDPNEGLFLISQVIDLSYDVDVSVAAAPVPEPGTVVLMLVGIGGLGLLKRRRS